MSKQVISAKNGRKTTFLIERDCLLRDFLRNRFSGRRIHFLRQGGCMYADGEEVTVNARLKAGQELVLVFTENEEFDYAPKDLGVKIIYEDDDIAVAYKPSGVASMPVAPYYDENLLNGLAFLRSGISFRVVTRLDKFTSGLVLLAKNALAHSVLNENHGKTEKFYTAVAEGNVPAPLEIIAPIKSGEGKKRFAGEGGKPAKTLVTAAEQCAFLNGCSLLKIKTFTGRTHQIRVHLAFVGHPLAFDDLYGNAPLNSQIKDYFTVNKADSRQPVIGHLLSCSGIKFAHPVTGETMFFEADGEKDLSERLSLYVPEKDR